MSEEWTPAPEGDFPVDQARLLQSLYAVRFSAKSLTIVCRLCGLTLSFANSEVLAAVRSAAIVHLEKAHAANAPHP